MAQEKAFFFGSEERPLYGVLYLPEGAPDIEHLISGVGSSHAGSGAGIERGVVICDSLFEEKLWCERVNANLGRFLADRGVAVLYFDYYGYGNSGGDHVSVDVEGITGDINCACNLLKSIGAKQLGLVSIRWGGAVAALAASRRSDVDLVFLVEPVQSWKKELLKVLRSNVAGQYAIFKRAAMTRDEIISRLERDEECTFEGYRMNNVDGYIISKSFYEQAAGLEFPVRFEGPPPRVVIYDLGRKPAEGPGKFEPLARSAEEAGLRCEVVHLEGVNPFWTNYREFTSTAEELYEKIAEVVKETTIAGDTASPDLPEVGSARATDTIENDRIIERAVTFESKDGHRLYGVLYTPNGAAETDTAVVFTHGGLIGMNGAFRFNTRAARFFASKGIVSLCFDPHGMGRAAGTIENVDQRVLFRQIQSGLFADDVGQAVEFLKNAFPAKKVTVFGVCGGAITNIIAHGRYDSIDSSVLLSIPVMLSGLSHDSVRMSEGYAKFYLGMYTSKFFNPVAWWRFITFRSEYNKIFKALSVYTSSLFRRVFHLKGRARGVSSTSRAGASGGSGENASVIKKTSAVTGSSLTFNDDFLEAFEAITARSSPILFVFGENDNFKWEFYSEFVEKYEDEWKRAEPFVSIEIVPHANHMYTLHEWQDRIVELCLEWFARERVH